MRLPPSMHLPTVRYRPRCPLVHPGAISHARLARGKGSAAWRGALVPRRVARLRQTLLAGDPAMAEAAGVSAELVERARERFDVGVAEVTGEVPVDCIPVVPASVLQFFPSLVGEADED